MVMSHPEFSKETFDFLLLLLPKRFAPAALTGGKRVGVDRLARRASRSTPTQKKEASRAAARGPTQAVLQTFEKVWDES